MGKIIVLVVLLLVARELAAGAAGPGATQPLDRTPTSTPPQYAMAHEITNVLVEAAIIQIAHNQSTAQKNITNTPSLVFATLGRNIAEQPSSAAAFEDEQPARADGLRYIARLGIDLDTAVYALASITNVKILQRPRIQTATGVPATLFVGERPYPVGPYTCGCPSPGVYQQMERSVTIEVTPLLAPDAMVLLDIEQKVDSFLTNVIIQNVGEVPITTSASSKAHVAVQDRQTVLLGGVALTNRVPIFPEVHGITSVPLIGNVLNRMIRSVKRTQTAELIVLLRPTVLPTPEVAAERPRKEKMPAVRATEMLVEDQKRLSHPTTP